MNNILQEGIYYKNNQRAGNSFSIIFLQVSEGSTADEIGLVLKELWSMYEELKMGIQRDIKEVNKRHWYSGNLSILIGYGPRVFSIDGCRRQKPSGLEYHKKFSNPFSRGGGPIIEGSSISYADDIRINHVSFEHLLLQFIGDDNLTVNRAIVETWKLLSTFKNKQNEHVLSISKIYEGFQRNDGRSWLGFHDGVSNLASKDRFRAIAISNKALNVNDLWTENGTYMSFIRIAIDLDKWQRIEKEIQEIIIGRDKITGCPIIGKDSNGKPIKDARCPVKGTHEVIERGNEVFREYPQIGSTVYKPISSYEKNLEYSHISRAKLSNINIRQDSSIKIYRQGFEFFESLDSFPGFRVGLNFISYQNDPSKLIRILQEGFGRNIHTNKESNTLEDYFSVRSAGIFLVPPLATNDLFPGMSIFLDSSKTIVKSVDYRTSWK